MKVKISNAIGNLRHEFQGKTYEAEPMLFNGDQYYIANTRLGDVWFKETQVEVLDEEKQV